MDLHSDFPEKKSIFNLNNFFLNIVRYSQTYNFGLSIKIEQELISDGAAIWYLYYLQPHQMQQLLSN